MLLAKITFHVADTAASEKISEGMRLDEYLEDVAVRYLCALLRNWQIYGPERRAWVKDALTAYVYVPRLDAIAPQHRNKWTQSAYQTVIETFGKAPICEILDDGVPETFPAWQDSNAFYLSTHLLAIEAPLSCLDTGETIPPYLLPLSEELRDRLYSWTSSYRSHDSVYMASGELEMPAYQQIADPNSELSLEGREFCQQIEAATGKPTYYYLHRYWGQEKDEASRPCPLCSGKWHSTADERLGKKFYEFDFRCDRCRIVSHKATAPTSK